MKAKVPVNKKPVSNADLIRQSASYALVDYDDPEPVISLEKESSKGSKKRERTTDDRDKSRGKEREKPSDDRGKGRSKEYEKDVEKVKPKSKQPKSLRKYSKDDGGSSEDETVIKRGAPRVIMQTNEKQLTEAEELQKKMDADIEERNAFVARMLEKEELKTKKLAEKGLSNEQISELATRGFVSSANTKVVSAFAVGGFSCFVEKSREENQSLLLCLLKIARKADIRHVNCVSKKTA